MKILVRTVVDDYIYTPRHNDWTVAVMGVFTDSEIFSMDYLAVNDKEGRRVALPINQIVSLILLEP